MEEKMYSQNKVCKMHYTPRSKEGCKACPLHETCYYFDGAPGDFLDVMESKAEKWLKDKENKNE